ncbi:MAG: hypothetical protein AAB381_02510 [Patescibacteria group bacterium]
MEPSTGVKAWQWVVTVIVIIVLIVIGIMVFSKDKGTDTTDTTTTPTTTTATAGVNRVVMSDQYPGNLVYLSSVQFEKGGWVVIHADNAGQPGAIIGQTYFDKGINPGRVTLTTATVEGGTYYAMLHSDDGDKVFSATKDVPLKDANGNIIMKIFRALASVGNEIKG